MSDEPTQMDWLLHMTRGHTPTENWDGCGTPVGFNITWHDTDQRWDEEEAHMAECNKWLVNNAPLFRDEVIRLREEQKQIRELLAEVLPPKSAFPQAGVLLWGLESELKRVTGKMAVILGMVGSEEE